MPKSSRRSALKAAAAAFAVAQVGNTQPKKPTFKAVYALNLAENPPTSLQPNGQIYFGSNGFISWLHPTAGVAGVGAGGWFLDNGPVSQLYDQIKSIVIGIINQSQYPIDIKPHEVLIIGGPVQ